MPQHMKHAKLQTTIELFSDEDEDEEYREFLLAQHKKKKNDKLNLL